MCLSSVAMACLPLALTHVQSMSSCDNNARGFLLQMRALAVQGMRDQILFRRGLADLPGVPYPDWQCSAADSSLASYHST